MKKLVYLFLATAVAVALASCGSSKNVAYFQNSDSVSLAESRYLYDAKIMPKDVLSITVSTSEDAAAVPFNLTVPTPYTLGQRNSYSQAMLQSYIVDNDGDIDFPLLGTVHLAGLTKKEAERHIRDKIRSYMNRKEKPIVTVRMINYKISVIGEVAKPGMFTVANEKISILEALAQAGDLTIYGRRDRVKLIREDATGEKNIHVLNLNDANIINSPYFYLQQNDVVYVEPNDVKALNSSIGPATTLAVSSVGVLVSIVTLIVSLVK
jgi:polysaccharide export outer membrane protein